MIGAVLWVAVYWATRQVVYLLWEYPTLGDMILGNLPKVARKDRRVRAAVRELDRANQSMRGDIAKLRRANPEMARIADSLRPRR